MYKVYCDDNLIYSKNIPTLQLTEAKLELELNKTGVFSFTIHPNHKYYDSLVKMKSIIRVYQNDELIFKGRILNEELSFYNTKQVTCEGVLAFLLDSVVRPFDFSEGTKRKTPKELLEYFITEHNKYVDSYKQFKVGNVNIVSNQRNKNLISRKSDNYQTTWNAIQSNLIDSLGGYIFVRYENDSTYIDYLKDFETISNQAIIFGRNLLDLTRNIKGENIVTAIIASGGTSDQQIKLNFGDSEKDLGDGFYGVKDYIYNQDAVNKFGRITTFMNFEDVTNIEELKKKTIDYLTESTKYLSRIEIKAIDLSTINEKYESFRLGRKIIIKSKYHLNDESKDKKYLVDKLSIDLLSPQNSTINISSEYRVSSKGDSFIDQNNNNNKNSNKLVNIISSDTLVNSSNINELKGIVSDNVKDITSLKTSVEIVKNDVLTSTKDIKESKELIASLTKRVEKLEEGKV